MDLLSPEKVTCVSGFFFVVIVQKKKALNCWGAWGDESALFWLGMTKMLANKHRFDEMTSKISSPVVAEVAYNEGLPLGGQVKLLVL